MNSIFPVKQFIKPFQTLKILIKFNKIQLIKCRAHFATAPDII